MGSSCTSFTSTRASTSPGTFRVMRVFSPELEWRIRMNGFGSTATAMDAIASPAFCAP